MQEPIDKYASQLLGEKGIAETPEIRADLVEQLNDAIDRALFESLTIEQIDELKQADAEGRATDEMLQQMLASARINTTEVANKALVEFREKYLKGEQ